jgi:hypothetical protein
MQFFGRRLANTVAGGVLFAMLGGDGWSANTKVMPPESAPLQEDAVRSGTAGDVERNSGPENPPEKSDQTDPYEQLRREREKKIVYIIVGVVLLLGLYWWTSGKLHHRLPGKLRR